MIFCIFWSSLLSNLPETYRIPFCSQSRPYLHFSVLSYSCLGCVDLCKVTLLWLWILCSILSVSEGTIHGLLGSRKSISFVVLLIFSTLSVSRLRVRTSLEWFLYLGPFGSIWSFFWSSIRIRVLLVGICSFSFYSVTNGGEFLQPETTAYRFPVWYYF